MRNSLIYCCCNQDQTLKFTIVSLDFVTNVHIIFSDVLNDV